MNIYLPNVTDDSYKEYIADLLQEREYLLVKLTTKDKQLKIKDKEVIESNNYWLRELHNIKNNYDYIDNSNSKQSISRDNN